MEGRWARDVNLEDYLATSSTRSLTPSHPGVFLREDVLPYIEMSKPDLLKHLGIVESDLKAISEERLDIDAVNAWDYV